MLKRPQRIMIFGRPGSGKSTCAVTLSRITGIPVYHLDKYFYVDNWVERNYDEFVTIQQQLVNQSEWIIDGNNSKSFEMRWSRATMVVYFNYPRWICYWRTFKRYFTPNNFDDRAPNCPETIRWCLLRYMWSFSKRVQKPIATMKAKYPSVQFYEIKNDKELKKILQLFSTDPSITNKG